MVACARGQVRPRAVVRSAAVVLMGMTMSAGVTLDVAQAASHARVKVCRRHHARHCVRAPRGAVRPRHHKEQGGPNHLLPEPTTGGLGGAGFDRGESAIAWARSWLGSRAYAWWCERFVENAFNTSGRYATAWTAARALGLHSGWAPRGALVFFRADGTNDYDGHVGISLGGTSMISALAVVQTTDIAASSYWRALYAGWAYPPASWPGRDIIPQAPPPPQSSASPSVQLTSPAANSTLSGTVQLTAQAANASGVEFDAYYATDPTNAATAGWHALGRSTSAGANGYSISWNSASIPNQGNAGWGTVNIVAIALDGAGNLTSARDYHRVNVSNAAPSSTPPPSSYPVVTTGSATTQNVSSTEDAVTLTGTFQPNGVSGTVWIEYGPTTGYGSTTGPLSVSGSANGLQEYSSSFGGLPRNATYHYQLVYHTSGGTFAYGGDRTVTTP